MRKFMIICTVVGMILTVSGMASANSIASSTMWFRGSLTDAGGVYTGTIDAFAGYYYVAGGPGTSWDGSQWRTPDGELAKGGFDVYAKEGGTAYVEGMTPDTATIGSDHDAYSQGGPWGTFYDPDVADFWNYQLTLTADHWYLEFKGSALGTPMSGTMDWGNLLASETDTGSYRGTIPGDPDANDGGAAAFIGGGGAGYWDMDWTWGSEAIPLQYADFKVDITDLGGGEYEVSLKPVPEPSTMLLLGAGLIGLVALGRKKFKQ